MDSWEVREWCDKGTLVDALLRGWLQGPGGKGVDHVAVVSLAAQVLVGGVCGGGEMCVRVRACHMGMHIFACLCRGILVTALQQVQLRVWLSNVLQLHIM